MQIGRRSLLGSLAAAALLPRSPLRAEPWPAGRLRILVGFPPNGPLDIAARIIAPRLAARLGAAVAVENRVGASGNDATREAARAAPDGGTLLLCGPVNAINATLLPDPGFDFARDLAPLAGIARVPLIVEVHPGLPLHSLAALIDGARARPGQLRIAYAGTGTPQHVAIALFEHMAGIRLSLRPYPGSAQALADLLRGEAELMFDPAPSSMPHVRAGRLRALATTGPTRAEALPDLPAVAELLPGYEGGSWFGLAAPRGTAPGLAARLNAAVNDSLAEAETARYADIIRIAGLRAG